MKLALGNPGSVEPFLEREVDCTPSGETWRLRSENEQFWPTEREVIVYERDKKRTLVKNAETLKFDMVSKYAGKYNAVFPFSTRFRLSVDLLTPAINEFPVCSLPAPFRNFLSCLAWLESLSVSSD